jgi:hypothetical protein
MDLAGRDVQVHTVKRNYFTEALGDPTSSHCPETVLNPSSFHRENLQRRN